MRLPGCGPLPHPCRVPDECPAEALALIYRCLSPDAAGRPTATELVELLMHMPGVLSDVGNSSESGLASPFGSHSMAAAAAALAASTAAPKTTPASRKSSDEVGGQPPPQQQQEGGGPSASTSRATSAGRPLRQASALTSASEDRVVQEAVAEMQAMRGSSPPLPEGGGGLRRVVLTPAGSLTAASPFRQVQ
jgi:hypothetical protein